MTTAIGWGSNKRRRKEDWENFSFYFSLPLRAKGEQIALRWRTTTTTTVCCLALIRIWKQQQDWRKCWQTRKVEFPFLVATSNIRINNGKGRASANFYGHNDNDNDNGKVQTPTTTPNAECRMLNVAASWRCFTLSCFTCSTRLLVESYYSAKLEWNVNLRYSCSEWRLLGSIFLSLSLS